MRIAIIAGLAAGLTSLWAQEIRLPANLEALAAKAADSVEVTMDKSMLRLAGKFLSEKGEDGRSRKLLEGLDSIYVRSFEFSSEGEYQPADLDGVRAQVQGAPWSRIVGVRSKSDGSDVDVYFKGGADGKLNGILVIAAERKELTIVSIVGTIEPDRLVDLGGQFGIPKLEMALTGSKGRTSR